MDELALFWLAGLLEGEGSFIAGPPSAPSCPMEWAVAHLHDPLTVDELAARAGLPPRTYARRFRSGTRTTPYAWLLHQRVVLAQRLLETTDHSVERIAQKSGFGSAATLRVHFERAVRVPPLLYRRGFHRSRPPAVATAT
jgi:AraC family transcriptional activator FtrA